jgi:uncharacterized protein (DUF924 family)
MHNYNIVIDFWFKELTNKDWFIKNKLLDQQITQRFSGLLDRAVSCELFSWRSTALGRLAEILLIDQFSRNIYRNTPRAFRNDSLALALAQEAIAIQDDIKLTKIERSFLYMPFMHSESKLVHEQAVILFKSLNQPNNYDYELKHKAIIDRFGRYPHRNDILKRQSTDEEVLFLQTEGSSF